MAAQAQDEAAQTQLQAAVQAKDEAMVRVSGAIQKLDEQKQLVQTLQADLATNAEGEWVCVHE